MPQHFDNATRRIVEQYAASHDGSPEAIATFLRLLDEAKIAQNSAGHGRRGIITVDRIRQLIAEGLS